MAPIFKKLISTFEISVYLVMKSVITYLRDQIMGNSF